MPLVPQSSSLGLSVYKGSWTKSTTKHLLNRVLFGAQKKEIDYFFDLGLSASVDLLLTSGTALPSPPLNEYNTATLIDPAVLPGKTWIDQPTNDATINSLRRTNYKKWLVGNYINQDRSIREKLSLFWSNHFGTEADIIVNANYVYDHHQILRQNALGNYKQILKSITIDAGMLRYLNGYLNTKTAPDENYARELFELYTVGKDTNVQYTEEDIKAAAKILTGWRIDANFKVYFDATRHDTSNKQFSTYFNSKQILGKTGSNGVLETDELISLLFEKADTAKFICRKLYRFFLFHFIDDKVEQNIITPLSLIFTKNNFDIKPVLKALFESEHFYDSLYIGCQIKSPIDHIIGTLRTMHVAFPNSISDYSDAYFHFNNMVNQLNSQGQSPVDPPNVAGWPAYYQTPEYNELWINADTLPKRNKLTDLLLENGYTRNGKKVAINAIDFVKNISSNPSDPNKLVEDIFFILLSTYIPINTMMNLKKQVLLSGQTSDYYWTDAWNNYVSTPNTINTNIINTRLKTLLKYILNLPDYQLQ